MPMKRSRLHCPVRDRHLTWNRPHKAVSSNILSARANKKTTISPLPSSCKRRKKTANARLTNNAAASKNSPSSTSLARMKAALPLSHRVEAAALPDPQAEEEPPLLWVADPPSTDLPKTHPRILLHRLLTSSTPATVRIVRMGPMLRRNRVIRLILTTLSGSSSNSSSNNSRQRRKEGLITVAADSKAGDVAASPPLLEAFLLVVVLLVVALRVGLADALMRNRGLCRLRRRSVVLCSRDLFGV
jgi:hypothetical protein